MLIYNYHHCVYSALSILKVNQGIVIAFSESLKYKYGDINTHDDIN